MRAALAAAALVALCGDAMANGRPPAGRTIAFRHGMQSEIVVGATFGIMFSRDGGATWQWTCELAAFYGGEYDPFYAYAANGHVWATSNDKGAHVMRDGCKFESVLGGKQVSTLAIGPDGAVYAGTTVDSQIHKAADGATLELLSTPGQAGDGWHTIVVAPSDAQRVYLSGVRMQGVRTHLVFASSDGGVTFQPRSVSDFTTTANSAVDIVGVQPGAPDVVYARVRAELDSASEGLYRSDNGGQSWTRVLGTEETMHVLVRANGDVVVATLRLGAQVSTNRGASWTPLASPPHIHCLAENSAGEVWACTQNFSVPAVPGDGFALMKTTDLATWSPVVRLQDIQSFVDCPAGTEQHDACEPLWCGLVEYIAIETPAAAVCADPPVDGPPPPPEKKPGCCGVGSHPEGTLVPLALLAFFARRRKVKACCRASTDWRTDRSTCPSRSTRR